MRILIASLLFLISQAHAETELECISQCPPSLNCDAFCNNNGPLWYWHKYKFEYYEANPEAEKPTYFIYR